MAVHAKNRSFAEIQREAIASSVKTSFSNIDSSPAATPVTTPAVETSEVKAAEENYFNSVTPQTESTEVKARKKKDVLIGVHVTEDERTELRQTFCSNGFSLATAYRAAMTYLRQDIEQGKAYITTNGEILRK